MTGFAELVDHLRAHPDDVRRTPGDLARQFRIDEAEVAQFLGALQSGTVGRSHVRPTNDPKSTIGLILQRPYYVLICVNLAMLFGLVLFRILRQVFEINERVTTTAAIIIVLTSLGINLYVLFRVGMARVAMIGAPLFCFALGLGAAIRVRPPSFEWGGFLGGFLMVLLYGFLALPIAVLGGFRNIQREQMASARLSRQDLLEQLFAVRERIRRVSGKTETIHKGPFWRLVSFEQIRNYAFGFTFVWTALSGLSMRFLDPTGVALTQAKMTTGWLIVNGVSALVLLASTFAFGFLSRDPKRSLILGGIIMLAGILASAIPFGPAAYTIWNKSNWGNVLIGYAIYLPVVLAGGIGGQIEDHAEKKKLLSEDQPTLLMAEMLALEWKLRPQARRVCVMVVDAEKSSVMKASADPFEAEWSFRAYQQWLAELAGKHLGTVHSTAGDGAVIGFASVNDAVAAGLEIQREVTRFNQTVNRLQSPFRLRIGLHSGEVQGDLDQVQFAAVIDIAAHVEKSGPVGGLTLSRTVTEALPAGTYQPLDKVVDGFEVFVYKQPEFAI